MRYSGSLRCTVHVRSEVTRTIEERVKSLLSGAAPRPTRGVASEVCERCDVRWSSKSGRKCWICGQSSQLARWEAEKEWAARIEDPTERLRYLTGALRRVYGL